MKTMPMRELLRCWMFGVLLLLCQSAANALDTQSLFKDSFLDLKEDLADAGKAGRILMVLYEQDGCPYCAQMHRIHLADPSIVARLKKDFDMVQLDIWGSREVTGFSGETLTEKQLARQMRVQFSPTVVFYDADGKEIHRMAGLHKLSLFKTELDFLSSRAYLKTSFSDYAAGETSRSESRALIDEPFFANGDDLMALSEKARSGDKVLALLFVQPQCDDCREMHEQYFTRADTLKLLTSHFEVARINRAGTKSLKGLSGTKISEAELAKSLGIRQAPTMVFFDRNGKEILRYEQHLTAEHFTRGLLTFLGTHAYRQYPSLQDWLRAQSASRP